MSDGRSAVGVEWWEEMYLYHSMPALLLLGSYARVNLYYFPDLRDQLIIVEIWVWKHAGSDS
jgi:hypothetical protein